ncbi:MAG: hypothetical protein OXI57_04490 [Rhodospirillales bacterium]|nr:hypothetical protein [Rhodospirillales bacterium]
MLQVQSANSSIFVNATFSPPLFEWQGVAARFFDMIHGALTPNITINPRDFSAYAGNNLGDVWARFNFFGGNSVVVLTAEKLSIEFPNIAPTEYEMALRLIGQIDASFPTKFSDRRYNAIQIMVYEHAHIFSGSPPTEYMHRYSMQQVSNISRDIGAVHVPSARFSLVGNDGDWRASCMVETSEYVPNALFLHFDISLLKLGVNDSFDSKFSRINRISEACMAALHLERISASQ